MSRDHLVSRVDKVYRFIVGKGVFPHGWGDSSRLKTLIEFHKVMSCRQSVQGLIDPYPNVKLLSIKQFDEFILKEGFLTSPFHHHCPGLLPDVSKSCNFQLIIPKRWKSPDHPVAIHMAGTGDQFFWRRRLMLAVPLASKDGVASLIMENPFYGSRRPEEQIRSNVKYVSDIFIMGGGLMLESLALIKWLEHEGYGPFCMTGISMGGHMASLGATNYNKPIGIAPCLSWTTASPVFTRGVMTNAINWKACDEGYKNDPIFRTEVLSKLTRHQLLEPDDRDYIDTRKKSRLRRLIENDSKKESTNKSSSYWKYFDSIGKVLSSQLKKSLSLPPLSSFFNTGNGNSKNSSSSSSSSQYFSISFSIFPSKNHKNNSHNNSGYQSNSLGNSNSSSNHQKSSIHLHNNSHNNLNHQSNLKSNSSVYSNNSDLHNKSNHENNSYCEDNSSHSVNNSHYQNSSYCESSPPHNNLAHNNLNFQNNSSSLHNNLYSKNNSSSLNNSYCENISSSHNNSYCENTSSSSHDKSYLENNSCLQNKSYFENNSSSQNISYCENNSSHNKSSFENASPSSSHNNLYFENTSSSSSSLHNNSYFENTSSSSSHNNSYFENNSSNVRPHLIQNSSPLPFTLAPSLNGESSEKKKLFNFYNQGESEVRKESLEFMRLLMDHFTHLSNYEKPIDTTLATVVSARRDAYVLRDGVTRIEDIWPGCTVRYLEAGHVAAYLTGQVHFRKAICESLMKHRLKYNTDGSLKFPPSTPPSSKKPSTPGAPQNTSQKN